MALEKVGSLGDVSFLEFDGGPVYKHDDGTFSLEYVQCPTDDELDGGEYLPTARWTVYRVSLDPCVLTEDGFLSEGNLAHRAWFEDDYHRVYGTEAQREQAEGHLDGRFCPPCGQWISHHLTDAAQSAGMDPAELRALFTSENPGELAAAYETIGRYHGWANFDSYPLVLTKEEVEARYPDES